MEDDWEEMQTVLEEKPERIQPHEVKAIIGRVKAQKSAIKEALQSRDLSLAYKYLEDLRQDQLKHGGSRFLHT